ncbi:MAG: YbaB/EbfC family nucleoid-associated protein [Deltaproteobacteria bacterium]|nr:YbaB/EbfC family nucleoid-associated protein [Deltaproteobacteria bacterium]
MSEPFDFDKLGTAMGDMARRLQEMQADAARTEAEGQAGAGMVTVTANAAGELVRVRIDPGALSDPELLEDLVAAAANDALRRAREAMAARLAGLGSSQLP